ncbi:unnamed protein product [Mytilus coruscus]|uniref:Uncharacterized protein n=1 Tax=Mytilus coruscus TaxID=42192 RepID=A0A6J8B6X4_MYTCO|nr:unnamed protein product [Mytilus coruscus]
MQLQQSLSSRNQVSPVTINMVPQPAPYIQGQSQIYHQHPIIRNNNQTWTIQHINTNVNTSSNILEKQQENTPHVLYTDKSTNVIAQDPTIACSDGQNKMVRKNNERTQHVPIRQPTTEIKQSELTSVITENFQMSTSTVQSEVAPVLSESVKESTQIVHLEENSNRQTTENNQDANDEGRQNQSIFFFRNSDPQEQTFRHPQNGHDNRNTQQSRQCLNIITGNKEGVKGNSAYLSDLSKEQDIICLHEHWLWSFELQKLDEKLTDY